MSSPDSGACAHCHKQSTKKCTGCLGAPIYGKATAVTFYCSKDCQVADRLRHKSECRKLQARKSLARAAQLLQGIFYRIRMHAYPKQMDVVQFDSMYVEGSTIYLPSPEARGVLQRPPTLRQFPISFEGDKDQSHVEAVLTYSGCTEVLLYLHNFAKALLGGEFTFSLSVQFSLLNRIQVYAQKSRRSMYHRPTFNCGSFTSPPMGVNGIDQTITTYSGSP
jgi:MYND finger